MVNVISRGSASNSRVPLHLKQDGPESGVEPSCRGVLLHSTYLLLLITYF